jgi:excisionase family DNA binding protein
MDTKISKLLTTKEVAALLGLSDETIQRWIQTRRIRYVKVGARAVRIAEEEIQRIILQGTVMPRREPARVAPRPEAHA